MQKHNMRHFQVAHALHFPRHFGTYHFKSFSFYKHRYVAFPMHLLYAYSCEFIINICKETVQYNRENGSENQGWPSIMNPVSGEGEYSPSTGLVCLPWFRLKSTGCGWAEQMESCRDLFPVLLYGKNQDVSSRVSVQFPSDSR